jgi:hypothetical protein
MAEADLLDRLSRTFSRHPRPIHFTSSQHCCECAEHDQTLSSQTPASISVKELGNPGWDPICFVNDEGFLYYFPALARLAAGRGEHSYLDQFLFHMTSSRIHLFSPEERDLIKELLWHLFDAFKDEPSFLQGTVHELDRCLRELQPSPQEATGPSDRS